jgi:3-hydroxybutyrate dehydrogenase
MTVKTAVITGSTSGIGLAIAQRLAAAGMNVVINSFEDESEISAVLEDLRQKAAGEVAYVQSDLSQPGGGARLIETAKSLFGTVDVLVNNAGVQKVSPIQDFPDADFHRVVAVSLDSTFETIKTAIPDMLDAGWGRVINIASAHGLRASPFKSAYVATKHAVVGMTKSVALEVAEKGITVNAICPGYVWTPLVAKQLDDQMKTHGLERDEVIKNIMLGPQPTKQFVQPEEIAEMVHYLCGEMARSITGTSISIDGGWTAK